MDKGKMKNHVDHLHEKHRQLEEQIQELSHSYGVDEKVNALKKEKLLIRDMINLYETKYL